jgi:hypothetical protein
MAELLKVRVKTRTGQSRFRAGQTWHADRWSRVEVSPSEHEELRSDAFLDVEDLPGHEDIDRDPPTLEEQIAKLQFEVAELKAAHAKALDEAKAAHVAEVAELKAAHAKALDEAKAAPSEDPKKKR